MPAALAARAYWPCWIVATILTGLVAGTMLGHALILGRFDEWVLTSGMPELPREYARFRAGAGRPWLLAFYAVCGLQVLSGLVFLAIAFAARRHRAAAAVAAVCGAAWVVVHYASGFAALEASVLRDTTAVTREVRDRFLAWNAPIHFLHAATLAAALVALLSVPLSALRQRG